MIFSYVYAIHACHLDVYLLLWNEVVEFHNVDIINNIDSTFFWDIFRTKKMIFVNLDVLIIKKARDIKLSKALQS
jgi:hypothetical protein